MPNKIHCDVCDRDYAKSYIHKHNKTKKHLDAVAISSEDDDVQFIRVVPARGSMTEHECCICTEDISTKTLHTTKCGHHYHKKCLNKWLKINNTCPMCRNELTRPKRRVARVQIPIRTAPIRIARDIDGYPIRNHYTGYTPPVR